MLVTTRALVFHLSRYSDSSGIVKLYTEQAGLQSVIVKSLFSKSSRFKPAFFGHLSLLDIIIDQKPNRHLNYLREVSMNQVFHGITDSVSKSSILLFMNEVLNKVVREEEVNDVLFRFIEQSLIYLDRDDITVQLFPISFLIKLSEILGIGLSESITDEGGYFDLMSGLNQAKEPEHRYFISGDKLSLLRHIAASDYSELSNICAPRHLRGEILNDLLNFYKIHIPDLADIKSVKIFQDLNS